MKRSKLTPEEHQDLGRALRESRLAFSALYIRLSEAYGVSKRPGRLARNVEIEINKLRNEMDSLYFNEVEGATAKNTPYYGREKENS